MSTRITRGFGRLGIGAAVLVALVGAGLTGMFAIEYSGPTNGVFYVQGPDGSSVEFPRDIADAVIIKAMTEHFGAAATPPAGYVINRPPSRASVASRTVGIGLAITAVLALAAWGFFRGLGWVAAGFAGD